MIEGGIGGGNTKTGLNFEKEKDILDVIVEEYHSGTLEEGRRGMPHLDFLPLFQQPGMDGYQGHHADPHDHADKGQSSRILIHADFRRLDSNLSKGSRQADGPADGAYGRNGRIFLPWASLRRS